MNSCQEFLEIASADLDGAASAEERLELQAHLAACPDCAGEVRRWEEIAHIDRQRSSHAPAGLSDTVAEACRRSRPVALPILRRLAIAASIAAALTAGILAGRSRPEPPREAVVLALEQLTNVPRASFADVYVASHSGDHR